MIPSKLDIDKLIEKEAEEYRGLDHTSTGAWAEYDYRYGATVWADRCVKLLDKMQQIVDEGIDTSTDGGMGFVKEAIQEFNKIASGAVK